MIDTYKNKTISKVVRSHWAYHRYLYKTVATLNCEMCEGSHQQFEMPKSDANWQPVSSGQKWGGEQVYAWFKGSFTIPPELQGKELWLKSEASASEALYFLNGAPKGLFDYTSEVSNPHFRLHNVQPITASAKVGETFEIAIEAYAGQTSFGCMPNEGIENCDHFYPYNSNRIFDGLYVVEIDPVVQQFLYDFKALEQLYNYLPHTNFMKWQIPNVFEEMFKILPAFPEEYPQQYWYSGLKKSIELMKPILEYKEEHQDNLLLGEVGLIGHSHLDTAWQWPVKETIHKAARTFSQALSIMELYPEYTFIQSSVLHLDWMKKYYPDIYEGIKARTAEGRWEPNGGSWVECDGNITGSECLIRQFVRGQRYLKDNLNYLADSFWQPDTFGYSASIPQIMKGCGMKYFLTTKLSWNECNKFPFDSFIWRGIDGSEVLTHFNVTHCWPDAETVLKTTQEIPHKDVSNMRLISYGFGDGGGGPSYSMLESSRRIKDYRGLPKSEHVTVKKFMDKLKDTSRDLPVYDGELYLELHRGTLTQKHDIKRSNRKCEVALRSLEMVNAHQNLVNDIAQNKETSELYDGLLLNQFHDILPGTSLQEVHELAIKQNYENEQRANELTQGLLKTTKTTDTITFYNPLSWEFNQQITIDDCGLVPVDCQYQKYQDLNGKNKIAILGVCIPSLSSKSYKMVEANKCSQESAFVYENDTLTTPFAKIIFDATGGISSFVDLKNNRELVKSVDQPLNTLLFGEDVPNLWDNWDIDIDQKLKLNPVTTLVSSEVVSNGNLQFRIRNKYSIGQKTTLIQDVVFYSNTPKIDFESEIDWQDKHNLLKTSFNVNLKASFARHEIQFGHVQRANHSNTETERAKFEVCNHKWSDFSENRFGVAILNDCKYGISVDNSDLRLTLHKGGCRPDHSGDVGIHSFTYSFLPHEGNFSSESVVRRAYELNIKPIIASETNTELPSILSIDAPNIIVETVKFAEDNDGIVLRLYEAECNYTQAKVTFDVAFAKAKQVNMTELEIQSDIDVVDNQAILTFKPFEIKTIKLYTK